jgi:type I restriction enzyme M protein
MTQSSFKDIEHLEADLWDAADNLRANSKLTAGEYCMPVLGVSSSCNLEFDDKKQLNR